MEPRGLTMGSQCNDTKPAQAWALHIGIAGAVDRDVTLLEFGHLPTPASCMALSRPPMKAEVSLLQLQNNDLCIAEPWWALNEILWRKLLYAFQSSVWKPFVWYYMWCPFLLFPLNCLLNLILCQNLFLGNDLSNWQMLFFFLLLQVWQEEEWGGKRGKRGLRNAQWSGVSPQGEAKTGMVYKGALKNVHLN